MGYAHPYAPKADVGIAAQHQVIKHPDVQERQGLLRADRDGPVGRAWLGIAGGVALEEHHRGRVVVEAALGDDARVDFAAIHGAGDKCSRATMIKRQDTGQTVADMLKATPKA
ncbi:hypothetical protein ASD86_25170 [Lysobacter sp. Root690]|nr:hypothetical protein ASD86_25170 [Lysobacter sp. Root690]